MEVIVPAAGLSSRFPKMKPKYLLYDYKGDLMLKNAIRPYLNQDSIKITIGILKGHNDKFEAETFISNELPNINVVILNEKTRGPADTVYQIIKKANIKNDELLIKDCDSFFEHQNIPGNYVCVSNISKHAVLKKLSSKSFVIANNQDIITNIIEKNVVSDTFCVGAYKFESVELFVSAFETMKDLKEEIYVSHVIQQCLSYGHTFLKANVEKYVDVGTAEDWFEYNDKPVIFCDIDGTIIHAESKYGKKTYSENPNILQHNVETILKYQNKGAQIIFTTARATEATEVTKKMLNTLGFKNYTLLIGLNNTRRILINDYNDANPYPRAEAINIKRDSDDLSDLLK